MVHCKCCIDNIIATLKSQRQIHNVDSTTSKSQCFTNFASTLGIKFTSQHIMDVLMTTSMQRCYRNVKLTQSSWCRYSDVAPALRQLCEVSKIRTIHGHMVTFPQACLKFMKKFNDDMKFSWYAGSILWH